MGCNTDQGTGGLPRGEMVIWKRWLLFQGLKPLNQWVHWSPLVEETQPFSSLLSWQKGMQIWLWCFCTRRRWLGWSLLEALPGSCTVDMGYQLRMKVTRPLVGFCHNLKQGGGVAQLQELRCEDLKTEALTHSSASMCPATNLHSDDAQAGQCCQ